MRGASISINMLIVIIIAVIVLLAVASLFMGSFVPTSGTMSDMDAWNRGCGFWKIRGCNKSDVTMTIPGYDPDGNGQDNTLKDACERLFGSGADCWNKCCNLTS